MIEQPKTTTKLTWENAVNVSQLLEKNLHDYSLAKTTVVDI